MSSCIDGALSAGDIQSLVKLLGDSIASYLSRGEVVHIERVGTFYLNKKGWIRFLPARTMKERTTALRRKHSR